MRPWEATSKTVFPNTGGIGGGAASAASAAAGPAPSPEEIAQRIFFDRARFPAADPKSEDLFVRLGVAQVCATELKEARANILPARANILPVGPTHTTGHLGGYPSGLTVRPDWYHPQAGVETPTAIQSDAIPKILSLEHTAVLAETVGNQSHPIKSHQIYSLFRPPSDAAR